MCKIWQINVKKCIFMSGEVQYLSAVPGGRTARLDLRLLLS